MTNDTSCEAALGELSMRFQDLENRLRGVFAALTDKDDPMIGTIIATVLPFKKLCDVTDALCRHRTKDVEVLETIHAILAFSSRLEEKRNTYIHSYYDFLAL